ncbi:hypothetical protein SAMN05444007_101346 [Cribrihabitans marinus]|uniref:Porin n=1 Tax=Cribrihabitans marinus TaxID=1227549 RepID=A0A1H6R684_9RHOB|nr:hypothetical protein [Cribrihabitans marinus]GGH20157.1 hypothetical protein GCM10010973_03910 [Cribrihabitans marinus]SEI48714.1 hypothetical protein SAMN05444007_101346 [Cribrihabitans marinus]
MNKLTIAGAVAAGLLSTQVVAAELVGGSLDIGYSQFTGDGDDLARYTFAGSGELAFNRQFSLQLDLGLYNFDLIDETARNITLHSNFHATDTTSLGLFLGRETLDSNDLDFIGAEIGHEFNNGQIEGYAMRLDGAGSDGTQIGALVSGDLTEQVGLSARIDYMDGDNAVEVTRLALGADYKLGEGAAIYGEIGNAEFTSFGNSADEAFVGAGLRIDFGQGRGTTFRRRGFLDIIPGL